MTPHAYPLFWPDSWPRTRTRRRAPFSSSFATARDGLLDEIRLFGGQTPVLSSNVELRRDGLPYANTREPDDPGVAVYFSLQKQPKTFACDRWDRVRDNLQANVPCETGIREARERKNHDPHS